MKKAEQKYKTEKKTYIVGFWMTADSALFQDPLSVSCLALFRKLPIIRQRKSRFIIFKTFDRKKEKLLVEFHEMGCKLRSFIHFWTNRQFRNKVFFLAQFLSKGPVNFSLFELEHVSGKSQKSRRLDFYTNLCLSFHLIPTYELVETKLCLTLLANLLNDTDVIGCKWSLNLLTRNRTWFSLHSIL